MNRELKVVEDIELNSQATLVGQLSFVDTVVHVVGFGLSCFFIKWHNISALMSRNACKYCFDEYFIFDRVVCRFHSTSCVAEFSCVLVNYYRRGHFVMPGMGWCGLLLRAFLDISVNLLI